MTKCMIVDDEPIAIRVLESHLDKVPDVEVVATCTDALAAIEELHQQHVDLVLLDIHMPELTGIDFVRALDEPPRFIFTTAHREYAVEGFELDAVDYLLKPIGLPRLLRALEKYRRMRKTGITADEAVEERATLNVRVDRRTVKLDVRNIIYIESVSDYVKIHTGDDRLMTKMRISDLAEKLSPHGFLRIHRSYVVPMERIDSFTKREVRVARETLPISRTYRQQVLERLRDDQV